MLNLFNANNNLDEIVFANRNKTYGAYQIRKQYNTSVAKSMAVVLGALCLLFLVSLVYTPPKPRVLKAAFDKVVQITETYIEVDIPPPAAASNQAAAGSNSENSTPIIKADKQVVQQVVSTPTSTTINSIGDGTASVMNGLTSSIGLPGKVNWEGKPQGKQVVDRAEVMPVFDNGNGGLVEYLQNQINFPKVAQENNISGMVMVVFEVDENGLVQNVMVENGIGFGCDEEAYRVVNNMPKWKPGMQNGAPVSVRLRLPISFAYH